MRRTREFFDIEKFTTINKNNELLLNELIQISRGKRVSVAKAKEAVILADKRVLGRSTAELGASRKVYNGAGNNYIARRNENFRIESNNRQIAKRLFVKPQCVTKISLDADYEKHLRYQSLHRR